MNNFDIDSLAGVRVAILGDVMLDRFVYASADRISPEAPVPVLVHEHETMLLGGAGNVARNIATLGGDAVLVGAVGDDEYARIIQKFLRDERGLCGELQTVAGMPTTTKTRFVCGVQQMLRLDTEKSLPMDDALRKKLLKGLHAALRDARVLVLSDYDKGLLDAEMIAQAIAAAREANATLIVDPKKKDLRAFAGADLITPNANEAARATGIDCDSDAGAHKAAEKICRECDIKAVLITRGARGMTLFAPKRAPEVLHIATSAAEVFDVSGAGDTVAATLALALGGGLELPAAVHAANLAAGIAVAKTGTAAVHAHELARAAARGDARIASQAQAAARAKQWRDEKLKVGFTNGCFDLIHPGHVKLIQHARAACDRLIVALNTDASVRRLKGESRPLQNEAARAAVIAGMQGVDLVVHFDDDTPRELIKAIRPDVLFKGADYRVDEVVGGELLQSWGGEVRLIALSDEGDSTSEIIKKVGARGGS